MSGGALLQLFLPVALVGAAIALIVLQSPLKVMVGIVGPIAVVVLFRIREKWLPLGLIIVLSLGSCYDWRISEKSFYLRFIALGLIVFRGAYILATRARVHEDRRNRGLIQLLVLFVPILGLITSPFSEEPLIVAQRAISFLMLWFIVFGYFWSRPDTADDTVGLATALWLSLVVILGIGWTFFLIGVPGMWWGGRLRLIIGNPNQLGHYVALISPIAVWYLFERSPGRVVWIARMLLVAMVAALIGTGSRGALLATVLSVGALFALAYRKRLVHLITASVLLLSIHYLLKDPAPRPDEEMSFVQEHVIREETLSTGSERVGVWKGAIRLIEKRPWFGYGFGVTDLLFRKGYFPMIPLSFQGGHVHNGYLEEILNLGWVGALPIFITLLYALFRGLAVLLRPERITANYRLACALYGTVLAGLISSIFESWFTSVGSVFCFPYWLCLSQFVLVTERFRDWTGEG